MSALEAEVVTQPPITRNEPSLAPVTVSGRYETSPYYQAVALQRMMFHRAQNPKLSACSLAQLARAWDVLEERKRILRGKPLPGQLRPDLHPDQVIKAAKRAKLRAPIDILSGGGSSGTAFTEEPRAAQAAQPMHATETTTEPATPPPKA